MEPTEAVTAAEAVGTEGEDAKELEEAVAVVGGFPLLLVSEIDTDTLFSREVSLIDWRRSLHIAFCACITRSRSTMSTSVELVVSAPGNGEGEGMVEGTDGTRGAGCAEARLGAAERDGAAAEEEEAEEENE